MKVIKYLVFGVIIVLCITFSALNAENVVINYYFGDIRLPMSLLLAIVFLLAVIISSLLFLKKIIKLRIKIRLLEKSNQAIKNNFNFGD